MVDVAKVNVTKLYCPITYEVMNDPVIAADDHSYDRLSIVMWLSTSKAIRPHDQVISPMTGLPLANEQLRPNLTLKAMINEVLESSPIEKKNKVTMSELLSTRVYGDAVPSSNTYGVLSSQLFVDLDELMEMEQFRSIHLKTSQIVAIGDEKSGKSTILERLLGYSIFPRAFELCTRTAIRVHLRRGQQKIPQLSVVRRNTNEVVEGSVVNVGLSKITQAVKTMMDSLVTGDNYINEEFEILVHIQLPSCPNLDILDLPGIVANGNGKDQTRRLVEDVIDKGKDHSIFLLIVDAKNIKTSTAAGIVNEKGIQSQTIGIFTKIDELPARVDVMSILEVNNGVMPLKAPWMASSSQDANKNEYENDLERMLLMEKLERDYLDANPQLRDSGFAGISVIKDNVQEMFETFIVETWVPNLKKITLEELDNCFAVNWQMGYPIPDDIEYQEYFIKLRDLLVRIGCSSYLGMMELQSAAEFQEALNIRVSEVCEDSSWMKIESSDIFSKLTLFSDYLGRIRDTEFQNPKSMAQSIPLLTKQTKELLDLSKDLINCLIERSKSMPKLLADSVQRQKVETITPKTEPNTSTSTGFISFLKGLYNAAKPIQVNSTVKKNIVVDPNITKLGRYPPLMDKFKEFLSDQFTYCMNQFYAEALQLLNEFNRHDPFDLIESIPKIENGVAVNKFSWNENVYKLGNKIYMMWMKHAFMDLPNVVKRWKMPPALMNEKCKPERILILKKMVTVVEAIKSIIKLEVKVKFSGNLANDEIQPQNIEIVKLFYYWLQIRGVAFRQTKSNFYLSMTPNQYWKPVTQHVTELTTNERFVVIPTNDGMYTIYNPDNKVYLTVNDNEELTFCNDESLSRFQIDFQDNFIIKLKYKLQVVSSTSTASGFVAQNLKKSVFELVWEPHPTDLPSL